MKGVSKLKEDLIKAQINRSNRNFLITNLAMIFFVVLILLAYYNQLYNAFAGPFQVSKDEIASIAHLDQVKKYHVHFQHDGIADLILSQRGPYYEDYFKRIEDLNDYNLHLVKINDKYLLVSTFPHGKIDETITGAMYPLEQEKEIYDVITKNYNGQVNLLPFKLDTTGVLINNTNAMVSILAPFVLLFVINTARYIYRLLNPARHHIYKRLREIGRLEEVIENINQEMKEAKVLHKKYYVSPNWIIRKDIFGIKIAKNHGRETNVLLMTFK
jgi:hypothetical protein